MLGVWPRACPTDAVLNILTYAGAKDAYSKKMGAGAGVTWADANWVISSLFVSESAENASCQEATAGGILTAQGKDTVTTPIAWADDGWTLAAAYTVADNGTSGDAVDADDYTA